MRTTPRLLKSMSTGCLGTVMLVIASILATSWLALQVGEEVKARPGELTWLKIGLIVFIIAASYFYGRTRTLVGSDNSKPNKGL